MALPAYRPRRSRRTRVASTCLRATTPRAWGNRIMRAGPTFSFRGRPAMTIRVPAEGQSRPRPLVRAHAGLGGRRGPVPACAMPQWGTDDAEAAPPGRATGPVVDSDHQDLEGLLRAGPIRSEATGEPGHQGRAPLHPAPALGDPARPRAPGPAPDDRLGRQPLVGQPRPGLGRRPLLQRRGVPRG